MGMRMMRRGASVLMCFSTRTFVTEVDMVSGIGYRRAAEGGEWVRRHHEIRVVVSDKAVLDFGTPDRSMRLRSVHPGVSVQDVMASTGFDLAVPDAVPQTRLPTPDELRIIREVLDPAGLRRSEVKVA